MRKIFFFTFFLISVGLLPCKGQQGESYKVSFSFSEGQANERVIKFLTEYALEDIGGDELKQYSDVVAKLGETFIKELYGGLPVSGRLYLNNSSLEFVPVFGSGLFIKNCKMIRIPFSDVLNAGRETKYVAYQYVKISTINGSFRFLVMPDYFGSSAGQDICNYILRKIGKSPGLTTVPGIYPQTSQRLLGDNDLAGKSAYDLKIMRNEVYARHGYIFKTSQMKDYFNAQSWYRGIYDNVDDQLTDIERSNIALIKTYEDR